MPKVIIMAFPEKLKYLRTSMRLTQKDFAKKKMVYLNLLLIIGKKDNAYLQLRPPLKSQIFLI